MAWRAGLRPAGRLLHTPVLDYVRMLVLSLDTVQHKSVSLERYKHMSFYQTELHPRAHDNVQRSIAIKIQSTVL